MPLKSIFRDVDLVTAPSFDAYILNGLETQDPNETALIDLDTKSRITFGQVRQEIKTLAYALHSLGVKKGDVIALCLPNCLEYMSIVLAILSRGAIFCGLNPNYTRDEYEFHIADCTAKFIFVSKESVHNVAAACQKIGGNRKIFIVDDSSNVDYPSTVTNYKELLPTSTSIIDLPPISIDPKTDAACMLYSSGTTGRPKGVLLGHQNMVAGMQLTLHPTFYDHSKKGDHVIGVLPMFHIMGLHVACSALRLGSHMLIMRKYVQEKYLMAIQTYKVPLLYAVPPTLVSLTKDAIVDKYDLSSIRSILTGAAPVGKELSEELIARFPFIKILNNAYGGTEIAAAVFMTPKWKAKPGSCGMLVPNFSCKIINVETGEECGPYQAGEILIDGPSHMLGYFHNPQATVESYKDGWYKSGDIGYYDEDGYFFIVDRIKELIKVKGFQVSPAELEDVLLSHPSVKDAAVIGKPDALAGEIPKAYVVKKISTTISESDLIRFVNERVTNYKHLKGGIEFVDEIPKSASGKILRRILQQKEKEKYAKSKM